jgi:adenylyltransferase/sulfurtransferase
MTIQEITVDELSTLLDDGVRLIDVREPNEWRVARVPGAVLVPLAAVDQGRAA